MNQFLLHKHELFQSSSAVLRQQYICPLRKNVRKLLVFRLLTLSVIRKSCTTESEEGFYGGIHSSFFIMDSELLTR